MNENIKKQMKGRPWHAAYIMRTRPQQAGASEKPENWSRQAHLYSR
jgi:hypothetical protein